MDEQPGKWASLYRDRRESFDTAGRSGEEVRQTTPTEPTPAARARHANWPVRVSMTVVVMIVVAGIGFGIHQGWQSVSNWGGGYGGTQTVSGGVSGPVTVTPISNDDGTLAVNLLAAVQAANGGGTPKPPTSFRKMDSQIGQATTPRVQQVGDGLLISPQDGQGSYVTPTVSGDRVYIGGGFGSLSLHSVPLSGQGTPWSTTFSDNGPSVAAVSNGKVVVNTESCTLYILDQESGMLVWSKYLGDALTSAPTVVSTPSGGMVVSTYPVSGYRPVQLSGSIPAKPDFTPTHVLAAFDLQNGDILWQKWVDGDAITAPVVADGRVHMTSFAGTRYAFDATDGKPIAAVWDNIECAPTVAGDRVVYTASRNGRHKLIASTLDASPTHQTLLEGVASQSATPNHDVMSQQQHIGGRPASWGNHTFAVSGNTMHCVDASTGKMIWKASAPGGEDTFPAETSPSLANGKVFVATANGEVLAFAQSDGELLGRYQLGEAVVGQVLVHRGHLVASTTSQAIRVVPTNDPQDTGWSTFGGNASRHVAPMKSF